LIYNSCYLAFRLSEFFDFATWHLITYNHLFHLKASQTDTHPYDGLFSRTTWANQHQKSQINLDFNEARDDGVAMASAGPYAT